MDGLQIEQDFAEPWKAYKADPSPLNSSRMLQSTQPVIDSALRHYGSGKPSPTLKSRAKLLSLDAFKTYDPSRGRLRTHLYGHLQGLQRYSAQEQNIISIPERVALDYRRLQEAENELRDRFGREPGDAELSDFTGLSGKRLQYIRQSQMPVAEGTAVSVDAEGDLSDPAAAIPGQKNQAWHDFVYYDLGSTDRVIMDLALGRNGRGKLNVNQIAAKLGITPSAVSQRTAKIQKLLDMREQVRLL